MSAETRTDHVVELLRTSKVAMLTYVDDGSLVSKPMATQDVDYDGTVVS